LDPVSGMSDDADSPSQMIIDESQSQSQHY
jgi:hypothetical protein